MNVVSPEVKDLLDMLKDSTRRMLPDEPQASIRKPMLVGDTVLRVEIWVRGNRSVIKWDVPLEAFGDEFAMHASLTDAIAACGLAGIVYAVLPAPQSLDETPILTNAALEKIVGAFGVPPELIDLPSNLPALDAPPGDLGFKPEDFAVAPQPPKAKPGPKPRVRK